jgi:hypothetical protein
MSRVHAIGRKCRECVQDPAAIGTWREQVAICPCVDCPLWSVRPLPRNAAPWIASRKREDLPVGFLRMSHDEAIRYQRSGAGGE